MWYFTWTVYDFILVVSLLEPFLILLPLSLILGRVYTEAASNKQLAICNIILPLPSHQSRQIAILWKYWWIKWSLSTTFAVHCSNLIVCCSSVTLLLSSMRCCKQDGSLMQYSTTNSPLDSDRWCVSLPSICHCMIVSKVILLLFSWESFKLQCMPFLLATCITYQLLLLVSM